MLKNYWSEQNKVTHRALQVQWLMSVVRTGITSQIREYHRIATKSYSYVGMNEATAKACQEAKLDQYTRTFVQWCNDFGSIVMLESRRCVANVVMSHGDGGLWNVDIDVNEDQMQYANSVSPNIPYYMFDLSFDYDESPPDGVYLRVADVYRESAKLYVAYEQAIPGFDRTSNKFHVEYSANGGDTWAEATPSSSSSGLVVFNSGAWNVGMYRVRWDDVASNGVATPTTQYSRTLTLGEPTYYGAWRMAYTQDFANFDPAELTVQSRTPTQVEWTDITGQCSITLDSVTVITAAETAELYFRISYDGVTSDAVHTPYNPENDKGDGSMLLLGAYRQPSEASSFWTFMIDYSQDSVSGDLFSIKCSEDGMAWSDGTITPITTSNGRVFGTFGWSGHAQYYAKVFYDGVQVTDAFLLPYRGEGEDGIWNLGLAAEVSYTSLYFGLRDDIVEAFVNAGGFPYYRIEVDSSTDGGETWTEVDGEASSGGSTHGGLFIFTNQLTDTEPRLFRVRISDSVHVTSNLKYPLA